MNEELNDRDIVLGLIGGKQAAWSALCERFGLRLWKFIARLVGPDQEAVAEIYQETMLAVAKAGRNLDADKTTLWSWLAAIGHNQSALYWRRAYRRPATELNLNEASDSEASDSEASIDTLSRSESRAQIRNLLAEMPADYVTLLTAKYLDDLSIAEIVELLGGTVEGVRSKLARARRDFRQRYKRLDASKQAT